MPRASAKWVGVRVAALAAAAALGTCLADRPLEPVGVAPVSVVADAGVADGGVDGGARAWRVRVREIFKREDFPIGVATAVSATGVVAGSSTKSGYQLWPYAWLADVDRGQITVWEAHEMRAEWIRALQPDGLYCGSAPWRYPNDGGFNTGGLAGGTPITGRNGDATRLLPDPLAGACNDMNSSGVTVGQWTPGFLRWPDAGLVLFDLSIPDGGPFLRTNYVVAKAINERNEVVGWAPAAPPFYNSSAGFYWSPDSGQLLLQNAQGDLHQGERASDINNAGVIVGAAKDHIGWRAAVWPDPRSFAVQLPRPDARFYWTEAVAINDEGLIVGFGVDETATLTYTETRGVVWWKGKAYLADDLVRGQTTLLIDDLRAVNDRGRIAGTGRQFVYFPDGGYVALRRPIVIDILEYPSD